MSRRTGRPNLYAGLMRRYGVSRKFLSNIGRVKFLAMREDVRELYVGIYKRRVQKAASK